MKNRPASSSDLVSIRAAHLGMIQGVISRMSGFSATAKNFAVTVAVATVAVAFDKGAPALLWVGIVATGFFLLMDGYYHLLEVRFRELYRTTAQSPLDRPSEMLLDAPAPTAMNIKKVITSATLLPFYVPLLFVLGFALCQVPHVQADPAPARGVASTTGQEPAAPKRVGGAVRTTEAKDQRAVRPVGPPTTAPDERARNVQ